MTFWSSDTLRRRIQAEEVISDFDSARVKYGAYEMRLGAEVFVTSRKPSTKQILSTGGQIRIPSGQFGLLLTLERVSIPLDTIAFISMKSRYKFRGLVNVSGFHVDPGFSGPLKFSVFNAGSEDVILQHGEPTFQIWFAAFDQKTDKYDGEHKGQDGLTSADVSNLQGAIASPGSLKKRLDGVDRWIQILQSQIAVLVALGVALLVQRCP